MSKKRPDDRAVAATATLAPLTLAACGGGGSGSGSGGGSASSARGQPDRAGLLQRRARAQPDRRPAAASAAPRSGLRRSTTSRCPARP